MFYLYDAPTNGNLLGNEGIATVTVSNGLFTVPLNFDNVFDRNPRWLQVSVEKSTDSGFTALWPRQQITPSPYAMFANTASNLSGTVASSQLSGSIAATNISGTVALAQLPPTVLTNGASGVSVSGTFTGVSPTNWGYFAASPSPFAPSGSDLAFVTTADVNGDHKIDLICANTNGNTLTIMTNDGSGNFIIASSPTVGNHPNSVTAADINGDGEMDLICAHASSNSRLSILTNEPSISASFMGNFSGNFSGGFTGDGTGLNLGNTISYTPTIGDGTHNFTTTAAQGYYTKIGDLVFIEIWLDWNSLGSATNAASNVYISLPLASSSPRPEFTLGYVRGIAFADQLTASGEGGSTNLNLWSLSSGYAPNAVLIGGCAASGDIQLSGFYRP